MRKALAATSTRIASNRSARPIDLVPPEMQEINLEIGRTGEWYMLTFRKPGRWGVES